jgi:hypothetical protein
MSELTEFNRIVSHAITYERGNDGTVKMPTTAAVTAYNEIASLKERVAELEKFNDKSPVDEEWLSKNGFFPDGDDNNDYGCCVIAADDKTEKEGLQVVWSMTSEDCHCYLESYDKNGNTTALLELPHITTRGDLLKLIDALTREGELL